MDSLKNSDFIVSLWAIGYALAYPFTVVLAFTGYAVLFDIVWAFAILAAYFHKETERRVLLLTGAALCFVNVLSSEWYFALPLAWLLAQPFLTFFDENCLRD